MGPAFLCCWRGCFVVQLKCFSSSGPRMIPIGKIQSLCYMHFLCLKRVGFFLIISFPLLPEQMKLSMISYRFCWGFYPFGKKGMCVCVWEKILRWSVGWHLLSQLLGCQKLGFLSIQLMQIIKFLPDFSVWNQAKMLALTEASQRSFL